MLSLIRTIERDRRAAMQRLFADKRPHADLLLAGCAGEFSFFCFDHCATSRLCQSELTRFMAQCDFARFKRTTKSCQRSLWRTAG